MSTFPQIFRPRSQQLIELKSLDDQEAPAKQNPEEDYFYWYYLNKFFPELIQRNYRFQEYYPDFIYLNEEAGLYIDIECDEPYVYETGEPTHYQELDSEKERNFAFTEAGWIVIRFAEEQIVRYPESCCKYIAEIIANSTNKHSPFEQFNHIIELPIVSHWTKANAQNLFNKKYRDFYLNNNYYNYTLPESRKELINCLKSFVNVENDTQSRELKETWALPVSERVDQGKAIAGLQIINQSGKHITVKFEENLSKFAPGDNLLLNSGNPQSQDNNYECSLEEEKDNLLVLNFDRNINFSDSDLKKEWVLDLPKIDLRHLLLDTLDKIESEQDIQDRIINIIQGKVKPQVDDY